MGTFSTSAVLYHRSRSKKESSMFVCYSSRRRGETGREGPTGPLLTYGPSWAAWYGRFRFALAPRGGEGGEGGEAALSG